MPNRNPPPGEAVRFQDRLWSVLRRCHWPSLITGTAIGFAGLYVETTRPLLTQINRLEQRIAAVDSRMHQLTGTTRDAEQAGSLLSVLIEQGERVAEAQKALNSMTDLQRSLTIGAQETDEARTVADRWQDLAGRLIDAQQRQTQSAEAIARIDELQQDIVALGAAAETARPEVAATSTILTDVANLQTQLDTTAAAMDAARTALTGIEELQQRLVAADEQMPSARQSATGLIALQQSLSASEEVTAAADNAERLVVLQQTLSADPRLNLDVATQNAENMVSLQQSLSGQTGRISDSVENLQLLIDFQDELAEQLAQVESLRRQVTELMLLETTLSRTMSALAPLTDLGNLRHLNESEIREVARTMLDRRHDRIATAESKYDAPPATTDTSDDDRLVPEPPID